MSEKSGNATTRISSFVMLFIVLLLVMSFVALMVALNIYSTDPILAGWLLVLGFAGAGIAMYVVLQMRKRVRSLSIEIPPVTTTVECKTCGFKNIREFQRGDYIFKEGENCQKCNGKAMVTAIYKEVKEKEKERVRV